MYGPADSIGGPVSVYIFLYMPVRGIPPAAHRLCAGASQSILFRQPLSAIESAG